MDVFDPNILQSVFLEAILQVGIKKSIGDLGPECPFKLPSTAYKRDLSVVSLLSVVCRSVPALYPAMQQ